MNALLKKIHRTFRHAFTSKIKLVENYLNTKYMFRYNTIKCRTEVMEKNSATQMFQYIDKRRLNTLSCELKAQNIEVSANGLKELLESDFSKAINPIHEYFEQLPEYKGKNFIQELSNTVSVVNSKKWNVNIDDYYI